MPPKRRTKAKPTARRRYEVSLPGYNEPSPNLEDYTLLIFGEKGIGKSSLAAQFPHVRAHFMWESGRRNIRTRMVPQRGEEPLNWSRWKEYHQLLKETCPNVTGEPGRIIIDTADFMAKECDKYIAQTLDPHLKTVANRNDYGQGWNLLKYELEDSLAFLIFAGYAITFISHVRVQPMRRKDMTRKEYEAAVKANQIPETIQPTCPPWAWSILKAQCDMSCYYGYIGLERYLFIRGHEQMETACGIDENGKGPSRFLQPKGKSKAGEPLDALHMGYAPDQAYHNLCLAWDNKLEGYFHPST